MTSLNSSSFLVAYESASKLLTQKNYAEAAFYYQQALRLNPSFSPAYFGLGLLFMDIGQHENALRVYSQLIKIDNKLYEAFANRAAIFIIMKMYQEAIVDLNEALKLNNLDPEIYVNKGVVLNYLSRFDEAVDCFETAKKLGDKSHHIFNNLGISLYKLKRMAEALENYSEGLSIYPKSAVMHYNLGAVFHEMAGYQEALKHYDKAVGLDPNYADAYWNKSLIQLLMGHYEEGWKNFEYRKKKEDLANQYPVFNKPIWLGIESIRDKRILITSEQGFGDVIQFCRYTLILRDLGAKVLICVPENLTSVMQTLDDQFVVLKIGDDFPPFDFHCPIMSLPFAFRTSIETIPAKYPYLLASKNKIIYWKKKLKRKTKLRVGLCWSGNPKQKNDHNRSMPLKQLEPLFNHSIEFHVLQKDVRQEDLIYLNSLAEIHQHQDELFDFEDTAALIEEMDLVISVCTSIAHLTGAMNKKLWVLLPYVPDYRWMLDRRDSPWYPSAVLFRQSNVDDWKSVIDQVCFELKKLANANSLS